MDRLATRADSSGHSGFAARPGEAVAPASLDEAAVPARPGETATLARLGGTAMGTSWSVRLALPADADLHALHDGVQVRLDTVVAQMSDWEANSDLARFNRAEAGAWRWLPEEFFAVLACALRVAEASGGAFDPTLGPLVRAWGFGPAAAPRVPAAAALEAARARVGWRRVALDAAGRRALQPGGVALDLSGIAKGFAVDLVARHLRERGIAAALVEVGGELYGYGRKPDGGAWRVLVETAGDAAAGAAGTEACVLELDGHAVATSGDRWHWFEQDGRRYAHTLDPRTGVPVAHAPAAVTVVAEDAMRADAWATALTVLGARDGFAFAQANGIAARFVAAGPEGAERDTRAPAPMTTEAFRRWLAS